MKDSPPVVHPHEKELEELRHENALLRGLIENSRDMVYRMSLPDGIYEYVSPSSAEVFGYTPSEFYDAPLLIRGVIHPDWREYLESQWTLLLRGTVPQTYEYQIIHKSGDMRWINQRNSVLRNQDGTPFAIQGIVTDITARKKTEEALRLSEERLRLVNNSSIDSIYSYDVHSRFTTANDALCRVLGRTQEDIIGKSHADLGFSEENVREWAELHRQVIEHDESVRAETSAPASDGKIHAYEVILNPIHDGIGNIVGISGITRDITDRKQLEEARTRASRLESIGLLAGGIAHDFNNILAAIMGNTSLAKMKLEAESEGFALLSESEDAIVRATQLTHQLLTFARGGTPIKEATDMAALINETAEFSIRGSNVKCSVSLPDDLRNAEIDRGQISQVLGNLVINAQQAMEHGGIVSIHAKNVEIRNPSDLHLSDGEYVVISVTDQGEGISPEDLPRIFDPYFTSKERGTGLGLTTSYSIIHRHGGHIEVTSEVGKGSTFSVYLKASLEAPAGSETEGIEAGDAAGKILVMDDDAVIRKMIRRMLESMGNEVEEAAEGLAALETYRKAMESDAQFDLVIMDLTIAGGLGGKETIQRLLEVDPKVTAIISSGYSNDPVISAYAKHGFKGFIPKPYKLDELRTAIHDVLMNRESSPRA